MDVVCIAKHPTNERNNVAFYNESAHGMLSFAYLMTNGDGLTIYCVVYLIQDTVGLFFAYVSSACLGTRSKELKAVWRSTFLVGDRLERKGVAPHDNLSQGC